MLDPSKLAQMAPGIEPRVCCFILMLAKSCQLLGLSATCQHQLLHSCKLIQGLPNSNQTQCHLSEQLQIICSNISQRLHYITHAANVHVCMPYAALVTTRPL